MSQLCVETYDRQSHCEPTNWFRKAFAAYVSLSSYSVVKEQIERLRSQTIHGEALLSVKDRFRLPGWCLLYDWYRRIHLAPAARCPVGGAGYRPRLVEVSTSFSNFFAKKIIFFIPLSKAPGFTPFKSDFSLKDLVKIGIATFSP